jgi:predicted acetyltransferase
MSWQVRPCASPEEMRAALAPISYYFGRPSPGDDQVNRVRHVMPPERLHAAWEGGRAVGGAGVFPFELTVPGGRVRAAGVTTVAVLPTHRRRGILTAMMRAQLDDCRARGEPVAYLWASEDTIYGRFGYGLASLAGEIDLARERSAYHAPCPPAGQTRLVAIAEAEPLVAPVYERVARDTPGMFSRSSPWWQTRILDDPDWRRGGAGHLVCAVLDVDGRPAAYALYRTNPAFERGIQTGAVQVVEAMGESPPATRAIWRFLLDLDWIAHLKAGLLPVDHPLTLLVAEPRRLRWNVGEGLWVRLVDVGAALAARRYDAADAVAVQVADPFCPWNEGRWRIGGGVDRTGGEPDLRCDVAALASVYLGGFTWAQLARALRVEEMRPGAIARADRLFAVARAPWCPEIS